MRSSRPKDPDAWNDVTVHTLSKGREDCQIGWQEFVGRMFEGKTILDVGAGLGKSRARLASGGNTVTLQDVSSLEGIDLNNPVQAIAGGHFQVVTAFDVIEHVVHDLSFLKELARISTEAVFITTPNYNVSKCGNPHHVREYTPEQFARLPTQAHVAQAWRVRWFTGNGWGLSIVERELEQFLTHREPSHAMLLTRP